MKKVLGFLFGIMIVVVANLGFSATTFAQDVYSCSDDQYDYYVISESVQTFSNMGEYSLRGYVKLVQDGQLVTKKLYWFDVGHGIIKSTLNGVRFYEVPGGSIEASICSTMMKYR